MNGIWQQAKGYVSPLPTKVMTDQTNVYKLPDTVFRKHMYVLKPVPGTLYIRFFDLS